MTLKNHEPIDRKLFERYREDHKRLEFLISCWMEADKDQLHPRSVGTQKREWKWYWCKYFTRPVELLQRSGTSQSLGGSKSARAAIDAEMQTQKRND